MSRRFGRRSSSPSQLQFRFVAQAAFVLDFIDCCALRFLNGSDSIVSVQEIHKRVTGLRWRLRGSQMLLNSNVGNLAVLGKHGLQLLLRYPNIHPMSTERDVNLCPRLSIPRSKFGHVAVCPIDPNHSSVISFKFR